MADFVLDARGLACPLPVLRARKILKKMIPGATLEIEATDPSSPVDFTRFCQESGYILVHEHGEEGGFRFTVTVPPLAADPSGTDST